TLALPVVASGPRLFNAEATGKPIGHTLDGGTPAEGMVLGVAGLAGLAAVATVEVIAHLLVVVVLMGVPITHELVLAISHATGSVTVAPHILSWREKGGITFIGGGKGADRTEHARKKQN